MKASEAQLRANKKYKATHVKIIKFDANIKTDSDIIEWMENMPNKQAYLRQLIRADIAKNK